jgi:hypothetical protein
VDDEDRDGGESMEKALSSHDREVRQKAEQQRRSAAGTDFDSNVIGASGSTNAHGAGADKSPLSPGTTGR